jgi:Dolichyl-phosphate-mannose-protein mannosyltransferase
MTWRSRRWIFLFVLFISAVYTAHVVQWSARWGRIAMDPVYDDVGYFIDGLQRLDLFQRSGIRGLCESLVQSPPHSPYSTLVATLAFDLFGVHDWAPYVINAIPLFLFLLLAAVLIRPPNPGVKILILLTLLMLQLPFQCILQFRPDFPLAVFTAACICLILRDGCQESPADRKPYRYFVFGLLGGFAILAKPPFFPATLALVVGAFGLAEIDRFVLSRQERSLIGALQRGLFLLAGILLLAGPFFLLSWKGVVGYITINTGSGAEAAMWKETGGFWASLIGRVRGYPIYLTFGPLATPLAIWTVIGLVSQALQKRWRSLIFTLSLLLFASASLVIVALIGMTDPNFSFGWEVLFALAAAVSIGELATIPYGRFLIILYFASIAFIYYKAGPPKQIWTVDPAAAKGQSLNQAVLDAIAQQTPSSEAPKHVFLTFIGSVNAGSQTWLALTQHRALQVDDFHRAPSPEELLKRAETADFVEVADPASTSLASWVPMNRLQTLLLERMRQNQDFEEVRSFAGKGTTVYLFRKKTGSAQ